MLTANLSTNNTALGKLVIARIGTHPTGMHRYRATRYNAAGMKTGQIELRHNPDDGPDACVRDALVALGRVE